MSKSDVHVQMEARPERRPRGCCCLLWLAMLAGVIVVLALAVLLAAASGRVNVLVLGLDRRPGEGDMVRADAIMVVTADPLEPYLGLMSIPRDLYLPIPGQGENRINTAHIYGEMEQPGSGPGRTAAAVTQNFGIPLDGWVRLDFSGFVALIDAVGGVEIDVPYPIVDYAYPTEDYGTMTIEIPAGLQTMDGERALQFARTRHAGSDFDRAERQQLVVKALVSKLARPASWLRLPDMYAAFSGAVDSNLSLPQLARLGLAVLRVGPDGLEHFVLDQEMVTPYTTPAGAYVLAPRWEVIQPAVRQMFGLE